MKNQYLRKAVTLFFIALVLIFIDQYTKYIAHYSVEYKYKEMLGGHFLLSYTENRGAMLSLGANMEGKWYTVLFQIVPIFVLLYLAYYIMKDLMKISWFESLAYTFLVAGGASNLYDRISRDRAVIDFMVLKWGEISTGIFNFADVWISIAFIMLILGTLKKSKG